MKIGGKMNENFTLLGVIIVVGIPTLTMFITSKLTKVSITKHIEEELQEDKPEFVYKNEFQSQECKDLYTLFDAKEKYAIQLITEKFSDGEMSYKKYMGVIKDGRELFYAELKSMDDVGYISSEIYDRGSKNTRKILKKMEKLIVELATHKNEGIKSIKDLEEEFDEVSRLVKEY